LASLTIRPLKAADVDLVLSYWAAATPADLERMGVDPTKLPGPDQMRAGLLKLLETPETQTPAFYMLWLVDGKPIGYTSLKGIIFGERGDMHLHIWDSACRGKGYGAVLFCKAALDFFERFKLRSIICEPGAMNPMPNGMLKHVGFRLLGSRIGASSELSKVCELNTYDIARDVAERYLKEIANERR